MQEKDKPRESPMTKLSDIINVPTSDPEDARRRRLLNVMLLGVAVAALLMLVALLVVAPMGLAGAAAAVRGLGLGIALVLLGVVAIYALNRYLSGRLAAAIFVLLLIALAAITDEPRQVVDGRGLLVFAVPILAAGVLLPPWASFAAAGLSSLVVIIIGLAVVKQAIPNVPAIVSFFVLALVTYIFSRSLDRALKSLRVANKVLQAGEDAYRQRLLLALSQAAQAVQRARTPGQVYHIVGDEIRKLGYHALIFTVTDDGEHLGLAHLTLESALLRKAEQLTGLSAQEYRIAITPESFAGRSFIEKQSFFCERVGDAMAQDFPSSIRPLAGRVAAILGLKQIVFAPLVVEDEAIGLLEVVGVGLTEADVPAVSAFANQTAIALENALLYRQAQGHAAEMERRVAERTHALENTQAAALSMMRDAEEARKVAEQTNKDLRREIEERKRVEAELQRSNTELEQFVYVASHDLQEPLRKVQVFGDRLGTKYASALDERGRDYLERMQGAARRMQGMINDLLAFSRIVARAQPFAPVSLRQAADEAVSDLEIRIERTGGRVEVGPSAGSEQGGPSAGSGRGDLPTIEAEPTQMRQLLVNLIGNGLKFHRDGIAPVVKVYSKATGDARCQIFVEDNGIGFDEKYLDRIFQPFQRLHGRSAYEGSGIGLAICRKIAERHGGSITARSAPGEGATFIVTLPVCQGSKE